MAMRIGVDNLVYAPLTTDTDSELTYGAVKKLPGVMKISINPNSSTETAFYDDGPGESASTLGSIEVEIEKAELSLEEKAALLGHDLSDKGVLAYGASDSAPYVALGFRTLKSNGSYKYVWLMKGKFAEPEDSNETKGDSVSFQSDTITGNFAKTNHVFTIGGKSVQPWKFETDDDATSKDAATIAAWFNKPYQPTPAV